MKYEGTNKQISDVCPCLTNDISKIPKVFQKINSIKQALDFLF